MAESVEIIMRLLESSEPMDYGGEFWEIKQMRLQVRSYEQPRMPLAIASFGNPISLAWRQIRVYLAKRREEAWRDVEASIDRDKEYFFSIGLKAPY